MTDTHRPFIAPPPQARAIAVTMLSAILCHDETTRARAEESWLAGTGQERADVAHACLNLARAIASRLRSPDGMVMIENWLIERADDDDPNDPDRHLAAALLAAHLQTSTAPPEDYLSEALYNVGANSFNTALDNATAAGRGTQAFRRSLSLWDYWVRN